MSKHRFVDLRQNPPQELWLEQRDSGYFEYKQGRYSEQVLRALSIHRQPLAIRLKPNPAPTRFGSSDPVRINDRATQRYQLKRYRVNR